MMALSRGGENLQAVILMNVAMLTFTLNDTVMKVLTAELPLYQTIALRGVLTTAILLMLACGPGARLLPGGQGARLWPRGRDAGWVLLRSLTELGSAIAYLTALLHMPIANLSAILQSAPLAVTLGAALVYGERIGWRRLTAIAVGFGGVMLIVRPGAASFDTWAVLGLVAVVLIVVRDLVTRKIGPGMSSAGVAVWAGLAVAVMGFAGSLIEGWQPMAPRQAGLLLFATANLIIGNLTIVMAMRVGEIGLAAPFRYMALLWAILLGWAVFGTLPDQMTVAGALIVVTAGLFMLWRERQRVAPPA